MGSGKVRGRGDPLVFQHVVEYILRSLALCFVGRAPLNQRLVLRCADPALRLDCHGGPNF